MKIAVTGGTGLIGRPLVRALAEAGHQVVVMTRHPRPRQGGVSFVEWMTPDSHPESELQDVDAIIHLAGASINDGRWTHKQKQAILQSRIDGTKEVVRIIKNMKRKPSVVISGSAIGIYGENRSITYSEATPLPDRTNFLGNVCVLWEKEAKPVQDMGIRLVTMRTGVVLSNDGGAFPLMKLPYTFGVGGRLGSGKQWVPWIHLDDLVRLFVHILETSTIEGPVNGTAPTPVTMDEFGKTLGRLMHRPHFAPAPASLLKLALGEKSVIVLEGAKVVPTKALNHGFRFRYETLEPALKQLLHLT
ncbi:TIGR01777 family oxidoreductase [Exiguobacterium sp. AM39-5BH]|uniref:TIGR01777 family oxidoreductase n=1 Tax=Exiguobacterium sp. AM39-5BH TaxID=2292355 RepID=UPI000FE21B54|nr:TIGR01777 family oxidoreductase [Exiguobacterium sp. AM39-5BH]RHB48779.1 TIGR01777 family protein [Exiguobacterium sp. AM39-5BH]